MQNNIPTLYTLELDSSAVKSAKISTILSPLVQKIKETLIVLPWLTCTRSERCNLVKYLYPVNYWRLYKVRVGVRA